MESGWHYKDVLQIVLATEANPPPIEAAIRAIIQDGFSRKAVQDALDRYGAANSIYYKEDILNFLLRYANRILDDHAISDEECNEFGLLKRLFKIEEGDFYHMRYPKIKEIINQQMDYINEDGAVTLDETFTTANLQSMFDLSSEQFFSMWTRSTPSVRRTDDSAKQNHSPENP